jgi:hypothetical protein
MTWRQRQSGYALMMTLALVVLAAVALAGLAQRSMERAITAREAARTLKRQWAVRTTRATVLGQAEKILDDAERGHANAQHNKTANRSGRIAASSRQRASGQNTASDQYANAPMARLEVTCELAGIDYTLIVTDEQAKLHAATLLEGNTTGEAQAQLSDFLAQIGQGRGGDVAVDLQPLPDREGEPSGGSSTSGQARSRTNQAAKRLVSYDQVFDYQAPEQLIGEPGASGLVDTVTCWGKGQVNIRRAPAAVIRRASRRKVNPALVEAVIRARQQAPYETLGRLLGKVGRLTDQQRQSAQAVLTDRSTCHGLWMIARADQRTWYTFTVRSSAAGGQTHHFAW